MDARSAREFEAIYRATPLTKDTKCGYWIFRGAWLQKFASKKIFVFIYGLSGCLYLACYAYFNGTITTLEKRFRIPSQNTGVITTGNDVTAIIFSPFLSYYAGRGHRPRWLAFGISTLALFCLLNVLPHAIYGPGEEALALTEEYGGQTPSSSTSSFKGPKTKELCASNETRVDCRTSSETNLTPQLIFFTGQLISGIGGSIYFSVGPSYIDDNILKAKSPALISFSYFLRLLGPALGLSLASFCLKIYVRPDLKPTIDEKDAAWIGAWWLGWLVLAGILGILTFFISLFPKTLPRAAVRKLLQDRKPKNLEEDVLNPSIKNMFLAFKRILTNKVIIFNTLSTCFYFGGGTLYWTFMPKYIETQYNQTASVANIVTGTVTLVCSAIGVLSSGLIISYLKPRARAMAAWNVLIGLVMTLAMVSYVFMGCHTNQRVINDCSVICNCNFVKYSPVCGEDGTSYISACHAGCSQKLEIYSDIIYQNCSCVRGQRFDWAKPGACPVDCQQTFIIFVAVLSFANFMNAAGRATNFLVSVRAVELADKSTTLGLAELMLGLFAFIPSPIFFGWLIDKGCLVWGKTCSSKGNCWNYDHQFLRIWLNLSAAGLTLIGTILDTGVWYHVKDLKMFDDEDDVEVELNHCETTRNLDSENKI